MIPEIQMGYSVVYIYGQDKDIYKVVLIHGDDTFDIENVKGIIKTTSIHQIREANDVELMLGYRLDSFKSINR